MNLSYPILELPQDKIRRQLQIYVKKDTEGVATLTWMVFSRMLDLSNVSLPVKNVYFPCILRSKLELDKRFRTARKRLDKNKTICKVVVRGPFPNRKVYFAWLK